MPVSTSSIRLCIDLVCASWEAKDYQAEIVGRTAPCGWKLLGRPAFRQRSFPGLSRAPDPPANTRLTLRAATFKLQYGARYYGRNSASHAEYLVQIRALILATNTEPLVLIHTGMDTYLAMAWHLGPCWPGAWNGEPLVCEQGGVASNQ